MRSNKKPEAMLLAFLFLAFNFNAQVNYVPNPSFEHLDTLVLGANQYYIKYDSPWDSLKNGGGGASVVNNPIFANAFQTPRTGTVMAYLNYFYNAPQNISWRSYIQAPLIKKLQSNKPYCVTHYANLANRSKYAIDELSAYFDDGSVASISPGREAIVNAQIKSPVGVFYSDTLNWMKVQGTFTANGTETYITLGNFKSYVAATYSLVYPSAMGVVAEYYIDDVSVIEADLPAYAGRDTVLCPGDSVFIGRPPEIGLECLWFNNGSQIATGGGLWVKPATTQTYVVSQDVCGLIKKDTIRVQVKPKYNGLPTLTSNSLIVCPSDTIRFTVSSPPPGNIKQYDWLPNGVFTNTSNVTAKALIPQTTTFTLNINSDGEPSFCPLVRTNTVTVTVPQYTGTPLLITNLVNVCPNDTINLNIQNAPNGNTIKYEWLPKTSLTQTTNLTAKSLIFQTTTFTVNINNPGSPGLCAFTRTLNATVTVADTCYKEPIIPNIFTPNNDDVNDEWKIKFPYGYKLNDLNIYNRWGTQIYKNENLSFNEQGFTVIGWDGRTTSGQECSPGVYFYVLNYVDRDGMAKLAKGNITLVK